MSFSVDKMSFNQEITPLVVQYTESTMGEQGDMSGGLCTIHDTNL